MKNATLVIRGPRPNGYWLEFHDKDQEPLKSDRFPTINLAISEVVTEMIENNNGQPLTLTFIDKTD